MSFGHPSSSYFSSLISFVSNVFTFYFPAFLLKGIGVFKTETSEHTHACTHTHIHTHAHKNTRTHTSVHTHTYTHTHTSRERLCSPVAAAMKGDSDHRLYDTTDIGTGRCMLRQTHTQVGLNRTINFGCTRVTSFLILSPSRGDQWWIRKG